MKLFILAIAHFTILWELALVTEINHNIQTFTTTIKHPFNHHIDLNQQFTQFTYLNKHGITRKFK